MVHLSLGLEPSVASTRLLNCGDVDFHLLLTPPDCDKGVLFCLVAPPRELALLGSPVRWCGVGGASTEY